jgi:hypothetical protein
MTARVVSTLLALLLAVGAELSTVQLSFGMFFLFVAICVWHGWEDIAAGYRYLRECREPGADGPDKEWGVIMTRVGPMMIRKSSGRQPNIL